MRFQVPQFIDVEDKIFGPLTLKQFIYLTGAAGLVFLAFVFLPRILALVIGALFGALGLALAFYRVNNRPFVVILEAAFNYLMGNRLYLWKKQDKIPTAGDGEPPASVPTALPRVGEGKLRDIAWSLDVRADVAPPKKSPH